ARDKAWSAAAYRRPGKALQDRLATGGAEVRILRLRGASPIEGGDPIVADGKVIGAIGVSGDSGEQDGQVAKAGVGALR
ncbi:MAG: GlcG/HbpS family heme-binding protein, partial [Burkholderiales bacterium]